MLIQFNLFSFISCNIKAVGLDAFACKVTDSG